MVVVVMVVRAVAIAVVLLHVRTVYCTWPTMTRTAGVVPDCSWRLSGSILCSVTGSFHWCTGSFTGQHGAGTVALWPPCQSPWL